MKNNADEIFRVLKWLEKNPTLESMQAKYPTHWETVEVDLSQAIETKDHAGLNALLKPLDGMVTPTKPKVNPSKQEVREVTGKLIRQRMSALAIERFLSTSLTDGKAKHLGRRDLFILRRLFFTKTFGRKLVSNKLFKLLWPFVKRRNLVMPMAESHGVYCFYSKDFVTGLAELIGDSSCLEIAAGDGALARFLRARGTNVVATDDYSWSHRVTFPGDVEKLDALAALQKHTPRIVICSWPPAKNTFERHVFEADSVDRYILIGSRHKFTFGNWPLYQTQKAFTMNVRPELGALLLPPEAGGAVYVFDRQR